MEDVNEMSSEESTEQELAQEALAATETEANETEMMPVAAHVASKHKFQDRLSAQELENARLQGKLEAMESMNTTQAPTQLSPMDAEVARQIESGEIESSDELVITGKLFREQKAYEADLNTQLAEAEASKSLGVQQVASISAARLVHDDWDDVVGKGQSLLTKGQMLDVTNAGEDYATLAYDFAKAALAKANPVKVEEVVTPETKLSESEAEGTKEKDKEVPSQEEILSSGDPKIDYLKTL